LPRAPRPRRRAPKTHDIKATPETTFYRYLDADAKPVLTINSGDIIKLETATGDACLLRAAGCAEGEDPARALRRRSRAQTTNARRDHTLTGPIFVTGAEPGDSIEIRLRAIDLRVPIGGQAIGGNAALAGEFRTPRQGHHLDLKKQDGRIRSRASSSR
jgi:acetamidase/formamidase